MSSPDYEPKPLNTSAVVLNDDLIALTERLAENTHELWAKERLAQGWKFGPQRDDNLKEHPGLVAYAALPESEKQFDRETALGALKAIVALGAAIEGPQPPPTAVEARAGDAWEAWLMAEINAVEIDRAHPRGFDFDMDDEPEIGASAPAEADMDDQPDLDSKKLATFPTLSRALRAFQQDLVPAWIEKDKEANAIQKRHRGVARWSIVPGVLAILLAIIQLSLRDKNHQTLSYCVTAAELLAAIVAAAAVWHGFHAETRNKWLAARQAAERLRVVKFRALADPDLWCNFKAWRERWVSKVADLRRLTFKEAAHWVHTGTAEPDIAKKLPCMVPTAEGRAIADYYRAKRQRYQANYFVTKAAEHQRNMWVLRLHLPVLLFFGSVGVVILHVFFEAPELFSFLKGEAHVGSSAQDGENEVFVTILLALAAALPVLGFGLRAWFGAFELPRRAQLFEGKAAQLQDSLARLENDRLNPRQTFTHIELGEHFFENEHREWCRLILEAEWFV